MELRAIKYKWADRFAGDVPEDTLFFQVDGIGDNLVALVSGPVDFVHSSLDDIEYVPTREFYKAGERTESNGVKQLLKDMGVEL